MRQSMILLCAARVVFLLVCLAPNLTAATDPASDGSPAPYSEGVYRVYYDSKADLDALAVHFEPWQVLAKENCAILGLDAASAVELAAAGYWLERDEERSARLRRGPAGYPCYRDVDAIYSDLQQLTVDYPLLATLTDYGDSWRKVNGLGGYDLRVLKITNSLTSGPKPRFFLMANTHARELTTPETALYFADYLLRNYDRDPDVTWILNYHEIYVVATANPDGRQLAEQDCLQRKNRNDTAGSCTLCDTWGSSHYGVDLNRNNPYHWGGAGTSRCEQTYQGTAAASEPETTALNTLVRSLIPDQRGSGDYAVAPDTTTGLLITLHSYSNLVLWPWGWSNNVAPNSARLQTLGRKFAWFNGYTPQQSKDLYTTTGDHTDWAYGELGIPAYTFECGEDFFQPCEDLAQIRDENLGALLYAAKVPRTPYLTCAGPDTLSPAALPRAAAPGEAVTLTATVTDTRFNQSNGTEPTQNVAAAECYVDTPPWVGSPAPVPLAMSAADGAFDEPAEDVTAVLSTAGWPLGRHIVFVRGRDADGNWGAVSAAFVYVLDPVLSPVVEGFVRSGEGGQPLSAVVAIGDFQAATSPSTGYYRLMLCAGTHDLTALASGYETATLTDISVPDSTLLHQDFFLASRAATLDDDVESGSGGWTADTPWAITAEASASPTHSWTDSPGGPYGNSRDCSLTSPALDLSAVAGVTLSFQHIYDLEATWDYGRVEYSVAGGAWVEAAAYTGTGHTTWSPVTLPLPALDGQANARLRFRFYSDSSYAYDGWHLDDIVLDALLPDLPGDFNRDRAVGGADRQLLAAYLAGSQAAVPTGNASADLNLDAGTDILDLVTMQAAGK